MTSIEACTLPEGALLGRYAESGAYTDCFSTEIAGAVSQAQYVTAFYTTFVFKLERVILRLALSMPSTDAEARQLADGSLHAFAAWRVEDRSENQLLMSDFRDRTRSWLMLVPAAAGSGVRTRLYFGSAVVPVRDKKTGAPTMGPEFRLLLGFHKLYSRVLLHSARLRLEKTV